MHPRLAAALMALIVLTAACSSASDSGKNPSRTSNADTTIAAEADPTAWDMPDAFTAVLARFVGSETAAVAGSDGRLHMVYELWLTNGRQVPASISTIEVLDADTEEVIATLADDDLLEVTHDLSTAPAEDTDLDPSESSLVYIDLDFATSEDVPDRIVHRLVGTGATNPGSQEPEPIDYLAAPWAVSKASTPVLAAPLEGEGWVAMNGCCGEAGAHRGSVQTINGTLFNAQRFAIDWMRVDDEGRFISDGDPSDPANWNAYGADVLAVADGTVVEVLDDLDDQQPGELPEPGSITLETVDGNHVILDIGNGRYVFYAHLKPGSVQVEEGDKVTTGDVLGTLGNSGNTSAPHLHIHVMDGPSALASDSLPYTFADFELTGAVDAEQWYGDDGDDGIPIDDPFDVVDPPEAGAFTETLPLDLAVVTF